MHAPNYVVNLDHGADCSAVNSFNSYGLVVGGTVDTFNTNVHGSAYIASGGTVEEVVELDDGCFVTDQKGTGILGFALVKELLQGSNQNFAQHLLTTILENDGSLTEFLKTNSLTMRVLPSKPVSRLLAAFDVNPDKTYILNIPVTNGGIFALMTPHPLQGFYPFNIIYNLYPG